MRDRDRNFLLKSNFIGVILLGVGLLFAMIALIVLLVPINPENMILWVGGIHRTATESHVATFRLIFCGLFGGLGLIMMIVGGAMLFRSETRNRRNAELKAEGHFVWADITENGKLNVWVCGNVLRYLRCTYNDGNRVYIFKSLPLRIDPTPFLPKGKVKVYCDSQDMSRYFVDVDGSVEQKVEVLNFS